MTGRGRAGEGPAPRMTPMRSVFPALHDRLLSTLLFGAVLLFLIALVAASMGPTEAARDQQEGPPLFISGATPAQ